jgi:hypothetical protein
MSVCGNFPKFGNFARFKTIYPPPTKSSHSRAQGSQADCPRAAIRLHPGRNSFTSAGDIMADNHAEGGHPDMDYAEHERTYALFLNLTKYGAIGCIVLVIIMAVLTL